MLWVAALLPSGPRPACAHGDGSFPRTFNLDYRNTINAFYDSRYDLLCTSSRVTNAQLDSLRTFNPSIKRLLTMSWYVYYNAGPSGHAAQWGPFDAADPRFGFDRKYWDLLEDNDWWAYGRDSSGTQYKAAVTFDQWTGNFSTKCPPNAQGKRLCDVFADFLIDNLVLQRSVEGVYFDNCWDDPVHLHWQMWGTCASGSNCPDPSVPRTPETAFYVGFDLDMNGSPDHPDSLKVWWFEGINIVMNRLRQRMGSQFILIGNGQHHYTAMSGALNERFPRVHGRLDPEPNPSKFRWYGSMLDYRFGYLTVWQTLFHQPSYNLIDVETQALDQYNPWRSAWREQFKRFTLASALLGDGYYTTHGPTQTYTWWEPEYDMRLGWPTGPAYTVLVNGIELWKREFTSGEVWVNPTTSNAPATATSPALASRDGLIVQSGTGVGDTLPPGPPPSAILDFAAPYPNPTPDASSIRFRLQLGAQASLDVFDLRGRLVRHVWTGEGTGDMQTAVWDGRHDLGFETPPGIYFVTLSSEGSKAESRLVRLR